MPEPNLTKRPANSWTVPLLLVLVLGVFAFGLYRNHVTRAAREQQEQVLTASLRVLGVVRGRLLSHRDALRDLAAFDGEDAEFQRAARLLLAERSDLSHIVLHGGTPALSWSESRSESGSDLRPLLEADRTGMEESLFTRTYILTDGTPACGLGVRLSGSRAGRFLSAEINLDELLATVLPQDLVRATSISFLPDALRPDAGADSTTGRVVLLDPPADGSGLLVEGTPRTIDVPFLVLLIAFLALAVAFAAVLRNARVFQGLAVRGWNNEQDKFSVFTEVSLLGIFHADADGGCTFVSDRWCSMTGMDLQDALGDGWLQAVHPDDRARVATEWTVAARDGVPFDTRFRFLSPAGVLLWVAGKAAAIRDVEGACLGYFGSVTDITEAMLNEIRLTSLFEGAPVGLRFEDFSAVRSELADLKSQGDRDWEAWFDEHPDEVRRLAAMVRLVDVNFAVMELYDVDQKSQLQGAFATGMGEDARAAFGLALASLVAGRTQFACETVLQTESGQRRHVMVSLLIAPDVPDWSSVYVVITDLSERRMAQEALARSEAFLSATGRMAKVGGWEVDAATRALRWTDETSRIHQVPVGKTPTLEEACRFFDGEAQERFRGLIDAALGDGVAFDEELPLRSQDGVERHVHLICRPEYDAGRIVRLSGTIQDISRRKAGEQERISLERQVQHAQKLESLGILAGGIAHDFNNILMAILGHADIALKNEPAGAPVRENLVAIEHSTRRAADLAQQMLAYSGKGQFVIKPIVLNDLVREMSQMLSVSVSKKVHLDLLLETGLPTFQGDATQVRQVVMNLITNSSEAIGDQVGRITVSTGIMMCDQEFLESLEPRQRVDESNDRPEGPYVYLEVKDSGEGMTTETMERLFDPFFTTKFTGRGLGMAAVLGILRSHQGGVRVTSATGQGTTVTVLFPAEQTAAGGTLDVQPHPASERTDLIGSGVLLADDDATIREIGRTMLESLGLIVSEAKDGDEAVQLFQASPGRFEFVLLDLSMPKLDGGQVYDRIKDIDPDARIILVSGYNEHEATSRFAGRRLAGFLQKPYRLSDLEERLLQAS